VRPWRGRGKWRRWFCERGSAGREDDEGEEGGVRAARSREGLQNCVRCCHRGDLGRVLGVSATSWLLHALLEPRRRSPQWRDKQSNKPQTLTTFSFHVEKMAAGT
jgi:hypothetical protein